MITFKKFLEAAVDGKKPDYKDLTVEEAINALNTHCKDALWMLHDNTPLWRGDNMLPSTHRDFFMTVDTSATTRKSENTTNYYTVLFDNIPSMKDFPKRSKSFIGSVEKHRASGYGYISNKLFAMIPYDGVKIGIVGEQDMWDTDIVLFGNRDNVADLNRCWRSVFNRTDIQSTKDVTYADFEKLSEMLDAERDKVIKIIADCFEISAFKIERELGKKTLLQYLDEAYGPRFTGFTCATTADKAIIEKAIDQESEIWVSGKIIIISNEMWDKMRDAI